MNVASLSIKLHDSSPGLARIFKFTDLDDAEIKKYSTFLVDQCDFYPLTLSYNDFYVADLVAKDEPDVIRSMLTFKITTGKNKTFIEIYDVCTNQTYRRQRNAEVLIKSVRRLCKQQFPPGHNIILWLMVLLDNEAAQNLYIKIGFCQPRFTLTTPSGIKYPDPNISLVFKSGQTPEQQKQTRKMVDAIIELSKYSTFLYSKYTFHAPDLLLLKQQLTDRREWSCNWTVSKASDILKIVQNSWKSAKEEYKLDPTDQTNIQQAFNVDVVVPKNKDICIVCHTHPWIAYNIYDYAIASPSVNDYMLILRHKLMVHMIVAVEGVYIAEMRMVSRLTLDYLEEFYPSCAEKFYKLVELYLSNEDTKKVDNVFESIQPTQRQYQRQRIQNYQPVPKPETHLIQQAVNKHIQHIEDLSFYTLTTFKPSKHHYLHNMDIAQIQTLQQDVRNCAKVFTDLNYKLFRLLYKPWVEIESLIRSNISIDILLEDLQ
jgi:hypothetical protein